MTISEERLAKNETLFRAVNDRLNDLALIVPWSKKTEYLCECSDTTCIESIELDTEEYERARSRPTVFFLVPGHERPTLETVIEEHEHYLLVEKLIDVQAVVETEPRSNDPDAASPAQ